MAKAKRERTKRSILEFELRKILPSETEKLHRLIHDLESADGVEKVQKVEEHYSTCIHVHLRFADRKDVEKIQRGVRRTIFEAKEIVVTSARSNLTELYD